MGVCQEKMGIGHFRTESGAFRVFD
jgi:hypothetical protein